MIRSFSVAEVMFHGSLVIVHETVGASMLRYATHRNCGWLRRPLLDFPGCGHTADSIVRCFPRLVLVCIFVWYYEKMGAVFGQFFGSWKDGPLLDVPFFQ